MHLSGGIGLNTAAMEIFSRILGFYKIPHGMAQTRVLPLRKDAEPCMIDLFYGKEGGAMAPRNTEAHYILMNQDVPVLDFLRRRNEFDEPEFFELQWHTDYRPVGYRGLAAFLEHRKAPKHRKHIQRLLEQYGCDDLEGHPCAVAERQSLNNHPCKWQ